MSITIPMAVRLGADHQRLQQFITSSTWDYAAVRRNVARWFAVGQPVEALVVDDTGFPKDGQASPCVARQYSGTLGKTGNCQIGVSVHLVNEQASCAADWRLYCPASWDDKALEDPVQAARAASRRARAGIPDYVRHTEKWRPGSMSGTRLGSATTVADACALRAPREHAVLTFAGTVDVILPLTTDLPPAAVWPSGCSGCAGAA